MRIRDAGRHKFCASCGTDLPSQMYSLFPGRQGLSSSPYWLLLPRKTQLHLLIENPLQWTLGDTQIARAQATIKPFDSFMTKYLPGTIKTVPISFGGHQTGFLCTWLVELQARLDEPDRICSCAYDHSCSGGRKKVYPRRFLSIVHSPWYKAFAVPICIKLDRARRDDAGQGRAKAFEESPPAFNAMDREQNLEGFAEADQGGAEEWCGIWDLGSGRGESGARLRSVEVGLKPSLENIQGRGDQSGRHTTNSAGRFQLSLSGKCEVCIPSSYKVCPWLVQVQLSVSFAVRSKRLFLGFQPRHVSDGARGHGDGSMLLLVDLVRRFHGGSVGPGPGLLGLGLGLIPVRSDRTRDSPQVSGNLDASVPQLYPACD